MTDPGRLVHVGGSFRDPTNRVFKIGTPSQDIRILRGVDSKSLANYNKLRELPFFKNLIATNRLISTSLPDSEQDAAVREIQSRGWSGVLEHEQVPFISYPYEWTFSMLKDAALLQLEILETALEKDWTLKDATAFNVQFIGPHPIFIDLPSFEPRVDGEPWHAYRQFCSLFLTPLMLRVYLDLDILPLMRSYIDGIPPTEAVKFFRGRARWRRGVLSHIVLAATVEKRIAATERDDAPAKKRDVPRHNKPMVIGLVQGLSRLVRSLSLKQDHSDWSDYDQTHSYDDSEHQQKKLFVEKVARQRTIDQAWDIGCNTGTFSRIVAPHARQVISVDADHNAVEKLYLGERIKEASNILPLVVNLANISPNQGWAGVERTAFDQRGQPDLVLVLALIHHIRISANIPLDLFLAWLRGLKSDVVIEFVNRDDEMVVKLLTNKKEQYPDYNLEEFLRQVDQRFQIVDRAVLKGGKREIFHLRPA